MRLRGGGSSAATVTRKTTTTTTTTSYDDDIEFEKQAAYENDSNSRTESSIINHLYGKFQYWVMGRNRGFSKIFPYFKMFNLFFY